MMLGEPLRGEQQVFEDLQSLCTTPGYVHVLAHIAFRDNMVAYEGAMTPEAMAASYSLDRTVRTEFTTLLGLMLKGPISFDLPSPEAQRAMMERTHALLEELHDCLRWPMFDAIAGTMKEGRPDPDVGEDAIFTRGDVLREPIFYGGEGAYSFQYRDFAAQKYARDDDWLRDKRGFGIAEAQAVVTAVSSLPGTKLAELLPTDGARDGYNWPALPGFTLSDNEISIAAGVELTTTRAVLDAFTAPVSPCNDRFHSLGDFNLAAALPLVRTDDGRYVSLQAYGIIEALYDSPFYWMAADKAYSAKAFTHRGAFAESPSDNIRQGLSGRDGGDSRRVLKPDLEVPCGPRLLAGSIAVRACATKPT